MILTGKEKLQTIVQIVLVLALVAFWVACNTFFLKTSEVMRGEVINIFTAPGGHSYRPYEASAQATVRMENKQMINVYIPYRFIPVQGDVYEFELHESVLFTRQKYIPISKVLSPHPNY